MRISDWSSDVCSSDLCWRLTAKTIPCPIPITIKTEVIAVTTDIQDSRSARFALRCSSFDERWFPDRSEARRVGKECVSTCRSRRSTYHDTKQQKNERTSIYHSSHSTTARLSLN